MSYGRSLLSALGRSIDAIKHNTASAMRMEITPSSSSQGPLHLWSISKPEDIPTFATGCDRDIGGLSSMRLDLVQGSGGKGPNEIDGQRADAHARFWGTLSSQVPRAAKVEKSGYAGMRNKNRPTLFGVQTWDASLHPYLALRLRNSLALPSSGSRNAVDVAGSSLSSVLTTPSMRIANTASLTPTQRAKSALGFGMEEPPGPKYFVNIQTDGPVTSDLFQHRIWLDAGAKDEWQTVVIPLDRFLLLNTGQVSLSQISMMRQAIRTIGISCVLDTPRLPGSATEVSEPLSSAPQASTSAATIAEAPAALRRGTDAAEDESRSQAQRAPAIDENDDWARDGSLRKIDGPEEATSVGRGSKRGQSFRFDLGIQAIHAVGSIEEAQDLWS